jgi:hypothetical protein
MQTLIKLSSATTDRNRLIIPAVVGYSGLKFVHDERLPLCHFKFDRDFTEETHYKHKLAASHGLSFLSKNTTCTNFAERISLLAAPDSLPRN